jgi:hypothetical protein
MDFGLIIITTIILASCIVPFIIMGEIVRKRKNKSCNPFLI